MMSKRRTMAESGEKRIEIYQGLDGEVVFDIDTKGETLWATPEQMATAFGVQRPAIVKHLSNIHKSGELDLNPTCSKMEQVQNQSDRRRACREILQVRVEGGRKVERKIKVYNLDAIISVGYRVNSKKATNFRIWATSVLKRFVTDGIAVNERRLKELTMRKEVKKLRDVEGIMALVRRLTTQSELDAGEANGVLEVISKYTGSFQTLQEYDEGYIDLRFLNQKHTEKRLTLEICNKAIEQLKNSVKGKDLFGKERGNGFDGSLSAIYQSFDGKDVYPSVPEKAANLLYLVIKDHPFYDGNKRIGALLFILFLTINDYNLTSNGDTKISDRALTAIALLIAESKPAEKTLIVSLVCKLLE